MCEASNWVEFAYKKIDAVILDESAAKHPIIMDILNTDMANVIKDRKLDIQMIF